MSDTPTTSADLDSPEHIAAFAKKMDEAILPSTKITGWNAAKQRRFLEAIADGETVIDACGFVSLSPASAYAFRRRPKGRAFDLGWKAADLLARERVAARLMVRATEGQIVEITRPDGSSTTKHHYDNRLALQMLNRLDRYADASERTAPGHAARMIAADFDAYLELVGDDGGPARAGLFMLARNTDGDAAAAAELEPVIALARADRQLRCGTVAHDVDVADLDPARRADWTADQWARAEAAGLLVLAPPPAPEPAAQPPSPETASQQPVSTCQPVSTFSPRDSLGEVNSPVWFDRSDKQWRTNFPPPADFDGEEHGDWIEDDDYERELSAEEMETLGVCNPDSDEALAVAEADRDQWFVANAAELVEEDAPDEAEDERAEGDETEDNGANDEDRGEAHAPSDAPAIVLATAPQTPEHPAPPPVDAASLSQHRRAA